MPHRRAAPISAAAASEEPPPKTALVRDVLLDANVNRVVVRNIGLTSEQVNRLEHDVLTRGNVKGRHSPRVHHS